MITARATSRPRRSGRRAFTMVEVMVAGVITALVVGAISMSLAQVGRVKNTSKRRLDTFLRADAALNVIRRDLVGIIRSDDLFDTRFVLLDGTASTVKGDMDRDEIAFFNMRLRPVARNLDRFNGEGMEYETQYRIEEDENGPTLWQRRDAMPDEYPLAGGNATPIVTGVIGLTFEAYDGDQWYEEWDSDVTGLPHAVRITVAAIGHRNVDDMDDAPLAWLRTVVPIDRVLQPRDHFEAEEEELRELEAEEAAANGTGESPATGQQAPPPDIDDIDIPGGGGSAGGGGRRGGGRSGGGIGGGGLGNTGGGGDTPGGLVRPPRSGTMSGGAGAGGG